MINKKYILVLLCVPTITFPVIETVLMVGATFLSSYVVTTGIKQSIQIIPLNVQSYQEQKQMWEAGNNFLVCEESKVQEWEKYFIDCVKHYQSYIFLKRKAKAVEFENIFDVKRAWWDRKYNVNAQQDPTKYEELPIGRLDEPSVFFGRVKKELNRRLKFDTISPKELKSFSSKSIFLNKMLKGYLNEKSQEMVEDGCPICMNEFSQDKFRISCNECFAVICETCDGIRIAQEKKCYYCRT